MQLRLRHVELEMYAGAEAVCRGKLAFAFVTFVGGEGEGDSQARVFRASSGRSRFRMNSAAHLENNFGGRLPLLAYPPVFT
jgi:hypothetical protein